MLCQGYFFLTPCVTSCYFSTNVGRHNTAGRAKQHSVSQTAECIHAEMNCQFQSGLKIKTIKYTHKYCSPLLQLWLLLPFAPVISPDLDSSNCQNKVILLFLFCPSKTSPNCCKVGVSELLLNNFPVHSFLWADVHPLLFAFNRRPLTCSSNILQIMIMVNVCFYHCTTHFSCHPFVFEALCLSFLFLNVYILLWKRRTGWSSSVSHGQPELF